MQRIFIFIFVLSYAIGAFAQTAHDEIIVTASALSETVESTPAAVTVITKEEIDARAARDVADVLREVPGIVMSRTGSPGRATSLFTRGANSQHTLVLWNGIEINNPYFSGYDWGRFSTAGVEQVEVVRGPYSALYGSEAVSGVVNVLTIPQKSGVRGAVELGGHGLRNGNIDAAWVGAATTLQFAYENRADDGFAPNDDFAQENASLFLRYKPTTTFSIGAAARRTSYDLGIPINLNGLGNALVPSPNRRQNGDERQLSIPIEQTLGRFSYEITLAESKRNDDFNDPDDESGLTSTSTDSTTRRARLTTRTKTFIGTIVAGGEWERAEVDDASNFGPSLIGNQRTEKSFFIEDRLSREMSSGSRLEVSAGARYDHYDTFGSEISPRIAAAWIAGGNKFRVAYGEAFRAPSVGELYFPFFGNAALQAERSQSWEAGFDRGPFSATLFHSDFKDLIVFDLTTSVFGNIGRASARGIEIGYHREIAKNLYSTFSYTYTDTDEKGRHRDLVRRPRHSGSLSVGHRRGNIDSNITLIYAGSRQDILPVAPFSHVTNQAYTTVDANVQYHMGRFTPYVKLENATNEKYEEVLGFPSPNRRAVAGVRFSM